MSNGDKSERRVRSVSTTFDLKDIAVVAIAAFTAAGPFFAYGTRISVAETEIARIMESDTETKERVKELASDLKQHNKEVDELKQQMEALIESEVAEHTHKK